MSACARRFQRSSRIIQPHVDGVTEQFAEIGIVIFQNKDLDDIVMFVQLVNVRQDFLNVRRADIIVFP